ncbi:hypothetical protein QQ045_000525 [Rhodiola kirilowii]
MGLEYGKTYVVMPKGKHEATIVWLHGLGGNGGSWFELLGALPLPNIKWICPTAPIRPVTVLGGSSSTAWFDVGFLSQDPPDDIEGLDASATYVANLLLSEPDNIKLGIGGFSMGAATSLYSATCFVLGKYGNGKLYSPQLRVVIGLSGWLPCSKVLNKKMESINDAATRASSLPILLCHGRGDEIVLYKYGEAASKSLTANGFHDVTFKEYQELSHDTSPDEMNDLCAWLNSKLGLADSHPE